MPISLEKQDNLNSEKLAKVFALIDSLNQSFAPQPRLFVACVIYKAEEYFLYSQSK